MPNLYQQSTESLRESQQLAFERMADFKSRYFHALVESHSGFRSLKPAERVAAYRRLDYVYGLTELWVRALYQRDPDEGQWTARDYRRLQREGYFEEETFNVPI